jgi:hypothetical protein
MGSVHKEARPGLNSSARPVVFTQHTKPQKVVKDEHSVMHMVKMQSLKCIEQFPIR